MDPTDRTDELEAELATYRRTDAELRRKLDNLQRTATAAIDEREAIIERYREEGDRLEAELADRERDLERLLAVAGAETAEEFEERLAPVDRLHAIAARLEELANGIDSGRPRLALAARCGCAPGTGKCSYCPDPNRTA